MGEKTKNSLIVLGWTIFVLLAMTEFEVLTSEFAYIRNNGLRVFWESASVILGISCLFSVLLFALTSNFNAALLCFSFFFSVMFAVTSTPSIADFMKLDNSETVALMGTLLLINFGLTYQIGRIRKRKPLTKIEPIINEPEEPPLEQKDAPKTVKEIKTKALEILNEHKTISSLQWIMDLSADKIEKCGFQEVNDIGQKDITDKIDKGITFDFEENKYELIFADIHDVHLPDRVSELGSFLLYFNNRLVFKTSYDFGEEDYEIIPNLLREGKIRDQEWNIELVKLSEWIEGIPKIVELKREYLKNEAMKQVKKTEKKARDNFDLGKYSD